jgi:hypothetical protein
MPAKARDLQKAARKLGISGWCGKKEATPDGSIRMAGQLQSQFMAIARS